MDKGSQDRIPRTYAKLQALHLLEEARGQVQLPRASEASVIRAVLQSVEVALLNISQLMSVASDHLAEGDVSRASARLRWVRGFHTVLIHLSHLLQHLPSQASSCVEPRWLKLQDSPAYRAYLDALVRFDTAVSGALLSEAGYPAGEEAENLLHLALVCNQEASLWEEGLDAVQAPGPADCYEEFVHPAILRDAVFDTEIGGHTYYMQFRGLHQIPEILAAEANDHIEQAIRDLRRERKQQSTEYLRIANRLCGVIWACLQPLVDNLPASDYRRIRESLGPTSGSHSVNLHDRMFKDLYEALWQAILASLTDPAEGPPADGVPDTILRKAVVERFSSPDHWLVYALLCECLELRAFLVAWRQTHLHLPRNTLGAGSVKSLAGSPDALSGVQRMRSVFMENDCMLPLVKAFRPLPGLDERSAPLASYLSSPASLESRLLRLLGDTTRREFPLVQSRGGPFAGQCPFSPSPPHEVLLESKEESGDAA